MPTLLELAGAKIPQPMDGVSLVPTLRGQKQTIREFLHIEHAPCYNKPQSFQALTDGHFKYIWRPLDGAEQLFDLDKDPHEEHNLATADADKTEQWRRASHQAARTPAGRFYRRRETHRWPALSRAASETMTEAGVSDGKSKP